MALPLTALIPIMAPLGLDRAQRQLQKETLEEIRSIHTIDPIDKEFGGTSIRVRAVDDPAQDPLLAEIWKPPFGIRQYSALAFEVDGSQCVENIKRTISAPTEAEFTAAEIADLCEQHALTFLSLEINTFLLLSNIVRPGSLSAVEGFFFIGDKQVGKTKPFYAERLFSAVEASEQLGWPKLYKVGILHGWEWLRQSGALVDGIGVDRLGRALAAISHTTVSALSSTSSIELVWILLGLEALYSRGNVGLKEQLLAKTECVLGPRIESKKAFGIVYDFRSRLLHGDVDLPLRFTEFDAVEKYENFHAELARNENLALAVLLASIQWMALNNTTNLNFQYSLA